MEEYTKLYEQQMKELAAAANRVAELGYVASSGGNLSMRVSDEHILITPTKTWKRAVRAEDICVISLNGDILYAPVGKKPTGEWPFHTRIMRKRPDVKAIAHAHPPVLTGYSIANNGLMEKPFLPEPALEIGPILTVPYETPLSEALSEQFDAVIEKSNGFLMQNHGALFCSPYNIGEAVELLTMAEKMAESVIIATILGSVSALSERQIASLGEVSTIRNLSVPCAPGYAKTLTELYGMEK